MYRVILIDDERFILSSLEARVSWKELGFEIVGRETSALSGYEAICRLQPHVVFTDVKMPGMNGIELMKKVTAIYPQIRFVVLSGYAQFEYVKAAMECGAEGYCVKPFDEEEIHTLLRKIKENLDRTSVAPYNSDVAFFRYLKQDTAETRDKCVAILENANISPTNVKVLCLLEQGKHFEFSRLYSHMHFEADDLDGYIVETNAPYNIFTSYDEDFRAGISAPFIEMEGMHRAYEEAQMAYYQKFISEKGVNFCETHLDQTIMDKWRTTFEMAVVANDFLGIKESFDYIRGLLKEGQGDMQVCRYIYQCTQKICGYEIENVSPSELYTLMIHQYGNVEQMLGQLQQMVEAILLGDAALVDENNVMAKMEQYILKNYYINDLTLQTLAKEFQFNANYLSQLFSKTKHKKFTAYLTEVRMEHAKSLLKRSDATIGMIAEKVGYMEYFYFAKVFKKFYGMTPSEYRSSLSL